METLQVTARPDLPSFVCHHRTGVWPGASGRRSSIDLSEPDAADRLLDDVSKLVVDRRLGVVLALGEKNLAQLPIHQCGAETRGRRRGERFYLTDAGSDAVLARLNVLRRALEFRVSGAFDALEADAMLEVEVCATGKRDFRRRGNIPSGVVATGTSEGEFVAEASLRALAAQAWTTDEWRAVPFELAVVGREDEPTLGYLGDCGAVISILESSSVNVSPFRVVQFRLDDRTISVVAGLDAPLLYKVGLADLWLAATSGAEHGDVPRFRRSADPPDRVVDTLRAVRANTLARTCLIDLSWQAADRSEFPLWCGYGFVES